MEWYRRSPKEILARAIPVLALVVGLAVIVFTLIVLRGDPAEAQTKHYLEVTARVLVPTLTILLAVLFGYGLIKGLATVANNQVVLSNRAGLAGVEKLEW
jgi:hypothetical protein